MISVLESISDMNIGGAGRLLVSRIKHSDRNRFQYTVIAPHGSKLIPLLKNAGAKIIEVDGCKDKSFDLKSIATLYKIIKFESPDILNSHACITARISGRLAGVRVNLYTRHCDFPVSRLFLLPFVKMLFGAMNNLICDGIIAVSYSAKRNLLLLGIDDKRIKVIVNGAERMQSLTNEEKQKIKAGLKIPADAKVISIFARLEQYKDHKTFLRAANLFKNDKKIYFLIVGSGSLEHELRAYARHLGLTDNVRFLGFVDDVFKIMNTTDINVNSSIGTETSSLALSEGMSLGVPAIASDYLGNRYMVQHGVNGLIFKQGDYRGLAESISVLTHNKALYEKLSKNARERFLKELNVNRMTRDTEKYYISMLKKKLNISLD